MTTADLDATIKSLNGLLEKADNVKDKLSITDRLLKCYQMKLRFTADQKGGKFASLDKPTE